MQNTNVTVQTSLMPFNNSFTTVGLNNCKTLQDVVNTTVPYNFADSKLVVTHNGIIVPSNEWNNTQLKEADLIGLNFVPMGGGGGGKNTIMMIGVIVAAMALPALAGAAAGWAAGAYAGTAVGSLSAAWGVGLGTAAIYAGVYGGVMVAGSMLLTMAQSALMSTPRQSGGTSSMSESTTSFVEGARNSINKYGVVPINLGTNRMFPNQAVSPYVETSGENQYSRQIFTYGYGKVAISERKLGETDIDSFEEVEIEDRLEGDLNAGLKLYSNDVFQQDYNVNITKEGGYIIRTTEKNTDEVEIDITFQGLTKYNDQGNRTNTTVEFEIQYAPTGTEDWSVGKAGLQVDDEQVLTENLSKTLTKHKKHKHWEWTNTFIVLSTYNGHVYIVQEKTQIRNGVKFPILSNDEIVLGYVRGASSDTSGLAYVDNHSSLVPKYLNSVNDFPITVDLKDKSNVVITVGGGFIKGVSSNLVVTAATSQSLRKNKRIKFPETGQYDIRIRRLTDDSTSDTLINKSYLTAIRSIKHVNPISFANISGSAMRIKATDQLSGAVDSYNVIVSTLIKSYNPETDKWDDDVVSSNPADIFRYVLQSPAFAKALPDNRIDLDKLAEWWVYCNDNNLSYDRIIDYDTSIDDVLNDICAAGVATLCKVNNIYSVIIDNERPIIKGMITPRNSWEYKGNILYPEIPHALRVEFRNRDAGYETDERIVYADGYDESNATLYERLQFPSCTDSDLAYWYGRRYFATALLQPETHTFKMDFEHMTFNRGDRITLVNDVILVGVGQGRIKELLVDDVDNPSVVRGFTIDDEVEIPSTKNFAVRIRDNNGKGFKYHMLNTTIGVTNTFTFATPIPYTEAPAIESLCSFVEDGKELDLIITGIKPNKDQSATVSAINYAPERFNPLGEIPAFESKITLAKGFYQPEPPMLFDVIKTDESVMIKNSDGSLTSVAVIPLINRNENSVDVVVQVRRQGSTEWYTPTTLKKDPNEVILTGLEDGVNYDFSIRYRRRTGLQLVSEPLTISNIKFIGGSTPPKKVSNFRVTVTNGLALFEWAPNDDIDISHYVIRYTASLEDVTWDGAQIAMDKITSTSITNIIHKGVYLIKAVDMLGNESEEASTIVSTETGAFKNVVEELIQEPLWTGVKENVEVGDDVIFIDDPDINSGYYYFDPDVIDLGAVYEVSLSANIKAVVEKRNKIRDIDYIRDVKTGVRDIGAGLNSGGDWAVELQMNISEDGENWSGWQPFIASQMRFRSAKFRLYLYSGSPYITPRVSIGRITIDMPDRYETGEDVQMTNADTGAVVVYENAFWNNPAVNITVQDGAEDDRMEFIVKNNKGFTFRIFNVKLSSYVTRSFDYLAAGYGKVVKNESN